MNSTANGLYEKDITRRLCDTWTQWEISGHIYRFSKAIEFLTLRNGMKIWLDKTISKIPVTEMKF